MKRGVFLCAMHGNKFGGDLPDWSGGKSTMGGCNRQPLAEGKGVHREMESEGSRKQNSAPRNTNRIRHNQWN